MKLMPFIAFCLGLVLLSFDQASLFAADDSLKPFFRTYCFKCHGDKQQKGDRQFDNLNFKSPNEDELELLSEALDAINRGDMPPNKAKQASDEVRRELTGAIGNMLAQHDAQSAVESTVLRRLTRDEYRNTIRDLMNFHVEAYDPTVDFPDDMRDEGFANIGQSQVLSDLQLKQYLNAAQACLDKASYFGQTQPESKLFKFSPGEMSHKDKYERAPVLWVLNVENKYLEIGHGNPVARHATYPKKFSSRGVPHDGYYDIRVRADAVNRTDHPYDNSDFIFDFNQPLKMGLWIAPHPNLLAKGASEGRRLVRVFDLDDNNPKTYSARVWLTKGSTPFVHWINGVKSKRTIREVGEKYHPQVMRAQKWAKDMAKNGGKIAEQQLKERAKNATNKLLSDVYKGPRVRVYSMEIEGPTFETWPPQSHQILFGESTDIGDVDIRNTIAKFGQHAFRRMLDLSELEHYEKFVDAQIDNGSSKEDALKLGMAAILTSPRFLYLDEGNESESAELSQFELASRLSYFLWSSMPDYELFFLARQNKLNDPEVIQSQVERMLGDPKASEFVERFSESWLHLTKIGSMPPDEKSFAEYYAYRLESAMKKETRLFLQHLLDENKSILDLLDSDYTFVNDGLAKLYGLDGNFNEQFQRVQLPKNSHRGGLLGQAAILTLTANGVETSPVTRGVWVLETILGTPPSPPPPDVEPIEPDTRGTTTIREQLLKHRNVAACADCHKKIDPLGFPLEFYDPIGGFRDRYPAARQKGQGKPVDGSGNFPDGESFDNEKSLKKALLAGKEQFAKTLTEKLLVYGTGRMTTFRDHEAIENIADSIKKQNYGFRDLIKAVATSETFRTR